MHSAAVKIQSFIRGHLIRVHNERFFLQNQSKNLASTLESLELDLKEMRLTLGGRVQEAAVRIQKVWRGFRVRESTKLMMIESKKHWEKVREGTAGVLQAWFRANIGKEAMKMRKLEVERGKKLEIIRKKLALIDIKRLMHAPLAAYRAKKQKIVKKKQRKMARLDAISRLKSEVSPTIPPLTADFPVPELSTVPEPVLSDLSDTAPPLHPLGRTTGRLSLPTVAFSQRSADTVPLRQFPRSRPNTKAVVMRKTRRSGFRRPGGYLLSTQSSLYRYEQSSVEETSTKQPASKPPSASLQKPTEAWLRFSVLRKDLRLELTNRPKEPMWRYATRASGLESLPSTPFTDLRGSVSPGHSRVNTARIAGRRLLSSEMVRPQEEDQPESRFRYERLSLSTLS